MIPPLFQDVLPPKFRFGKTLESFLKLSLTPQLPSLAGTVGLVIILLVM